MRIGRQASSDGHSHHEGWKPAKCWLNTWKKLNCIPIKRWLKELGVILARWVEKIGGLNEFRLSSLSERFIVVDQRRCLLNISNFRYCRHDGRRSPFRLGAAVVASQILGKKPLALTFVGGFWRGWSQDWFHRILHTKMKIPALCKGLSLWPVSLSIKSVGEYLAFLWRCQCHFQSKLGLLTEAIFWLVFLLDHRLYLIDPLNKEDAT